MENYTNKILLATFVVLCGKINNKVNVEMLILNQKIFVLSNIEK